MNLRKIINKTLSYYDLVCADKDGLSFRGGVFIDLKKCADTFNNVHGTDGVCVGERDITASPAYFEFYAGEIRYKIVFDKKGVFSKAINRKSFHDLHFLIISLGYTTYDLS